MLQHFKNLHSSLFLSLNFVSVSLIKLISSSWQQQTSDLLAPACGHPHLYWEQVGKMQPRACSGIALYTSGLAYKLIHKLKLVPNECDIEQKCLLAADYSRIATLGALHI